MIMNGGGLRSARTARRRRRFRLFLYLLEVALVLAVLAGIGYKFNQYMHKSPRFQVKSVRVEGANVLREERIMEEAGITSADNLLLFDAETIRQRVEAMPYVKRAEVQRMYPDTIVIRIEERTPAAILLVVNRTYEVDEEGVVLREVDPLGLNDLPLITNVPNLGVLEPGSVVEEPAFLNAVAVWRAFTSVPLSQQWTLSELSAEAGNTIRMFCEEVPFEIRWGRTDFALQAARLNSLWERLGGAPPCGTYLELRFDNDFACG